MSYEIGKAALNMQMPDRVARTEYMGNMEIVRHLTGKDPAKDSSAWREFCDMVHLDVVWCTNDGPEGWGGRGRTTDMGHAVYAEDGSDYRLPKPSPFRTVEEVLEFNAVEEYGLTDFDKLVDYYERLYKDSQSTTDQVVTGGYYKTIVSGAIEAFGWDMLLQAAGEDPDRFGEEVLGSIFQQTLHHVKAWAKTSIEFYMCHDDMVWTQGPFMRPDFYRKYIFPRFKALWDVLHDAGKKVIFCSDGTFDMFLEDLKWAGADAFCFEPTNNLEMMVRNYGQTHALMGGTDCRTLTFGTKEDVDRELTRVFDLAKGCPGFIFATGNHFPPNIPLENAIFYFERVEQLIRR